MFQPFFSDIVPPSHDPLVLSLREGISRWLEQNPDWLCAVTQNPTWAVYQQDLDQMIFDAMDAEAWIGSRLSADLSNAEADTAVDRHITAWDDAFDLICQQLCQKG